MFAYLHPLINEGAGRQKSDPLNQQRIELVLDRYEEWSIKKWGKLPSELPMTKKQVERGKIVFPLTGTAVWFAIITQIGVIGSFVFVHGNSKFIGKCFTLATTYGGYLLAKRYQQSYNVFRYFENYPNYPSDIKKMIDNNDARYAHRWLKDGYLDIEVWLIH